MKTPTPHHNRQGKVKYSKLQFIINKVEKGTGLSISELKKLYSEEQLFGIVLYHITTTKKAICMAFNIPVEAACRYKRTLEKENRLVQSIDEFRCPYTGHLAHRISTNPKEFEKLQNSNTNQLNLF